ncbi:MULTISPECIES: glycoside hydrolase family protein [unclassified Duganella]|jgi:muramidase (phage lysozyme)|uniref:glycoside hydrolase family 24 protein n=1 Tax=unclassified Duganella TaxID=2636909 RepID=UPI0008923037|nr:MULTISPECIES: glycoside hydrolase family 104 protein [unclassified Duganella]SDH57009.1 Muramidase (phage lambda lysozyme) [Duganella sp. OV458]SDK66512.1 Muramidase (phage lambda lysozyme) [Duganella sp. OV510]
MIATASKNLAAVLDVISWAEGTSTSAATRNNGYDVIVTGVDGILETFSDYSAHPFANGRKSKVINRKGLTSNASGRYQHMLRDWQHYRALLSLPDFGPDSQDKWAIQLIRERRALPLIEAGNFAGAIAAISNLWASLPGANYEGQPMRKLDQLARIYTAAGGRLA